MPDVGEARFRAVSDFGKLFADVARLKGELAGVSAAGAGMGASIAGGMVTAGAAMKTAGRTLTTRFALPLGIAFAGAVKTFTGFDKALNETALVASATTDQMAQLHDLAIKLGVETRFTPEEAAKGMYELASAGLNVNQILGATPAVLDFATASGLDLGDAAGVASQTMKAFGLEAGDMTHIGDVLTKMLQTSAFHANELGDAFANAGQLGATSNQSLESVAAGLAVIRSQGVPAASAGVALRQAFDKMKVPTDKAAKAVKTLGIELRDSDGQMKQFPDIIHEFENAFDDTAPGFKTLQKNLGLSAQATKDYVAKNLFGVQGAKAFGLAMNATTIAINDGAEGTKLIAGIMGKEFVQSLKAGEEVTLDSADALDYLTGAYDDADGTTKKFADTMRNTLGGQLIELKGSIQTLAIAIVETVGPALKDFLKKTVIPFVNKLTEWVRANKDTVVSILKYAGIAAAMGPVLLVVGSLVGGLGTLYLKFLKFKKLKGVFSIVRGGLLGWIGVIGAVIAASPEARAAVGDIFKELLPVLKDLVSALMPAFKALVEALAPVVITLAEAFAGVVEFLVPIIKGIATFVEKNPKLVAGILIGIGVVKGLSVAFGILNAALDLLAFNPIVLIVLAIIAALYGLYRLVKLIVDHWDTIGPFFVKVWEGIKNVFNTVIGFIWNLIKTVFNAIVDYFVGQWNAMLDFFRTIWNGIKNVVAFVLEAIKNLIVGYITTVVENWTALWNIVKGVAVTVWNAIVGTIRSAVDRVKAIFDGIRQAIDNVIAWFGRMWDGIKGGIGKVVDGIKGAVTKAKEWLSHLNPFSRHSPSLVETVEVGTKVIAKDYADLADMKLKGPTLFMDAKAPDVATPDIELTGSGFVNGIMQVAIVKMDKVTPVDVNVVGGMGGIGEGLTSVSDGLGTVSAGVQQVVDAVTSTAGASTDSVSPPIVAAVNEVSGQFDVLDKELKQARTRTQSSLDLEALLGKSGPSDPAKTRSDTSLKLEKLLGTSGPSDPLPRTSSSLQLEKLLGRSGPSDPATGLTAPAPVAGADILEKDLKAAARGDTYVINNPKREETGDSLRTLALKRTYLGADAGGTGEQANVKVL